jgi:polyhydroxybutyrate depolymerase
LLTNIKAVKKVFIALSAILVWTAIPAVSAHAVSIGQACPKTTLGTRLSIRVNKKPLIVVCRNVAGRKKWIRAAVQTLVTTTTSTSTTSTTTTVPQPVISYTDIVDPVDPTLHTITIEGMQPRTYYLNVPASYRPGTPTPLLLAFHSRTSTGRTILTSSQILSWADAMNIIVVAVNGAVYEDTSSWNAGRCCTNAITYEENDVLLTSTIIDYLKTQTTIDATRVWAMGHSNGGMMAYRLACDLSEKITAVAVVTGALVDDTCNPTKPVSTLHIHGNLDPTVPYNGGGKLETPDIYHSVLDYTKANTCNGSTAANITDDEQRYLWSCPNGVQVELVNYMTQSHAWAPGYTDEILRFLFAHPRK